MDSVRIRELCRKYRHLRAVAERLEQDTIATLDRRHFSVVRPLHIDAFTLVS